MIIIFRLTLERNQQSRLLMEQSIHQDSFFNDALSPAEHDRLKGQEIFQVLVSLWDQLHIEKKFQHYCKSLFLDGEHFSYLEIESEISRIQGAMIVPPKKRWPFSPSERYREAQHLISNLDTYWEVFKIDNSHRISFKASHKDLDNETLDQIWQEHETMRKLTQDERSRRFELSEKARLEHITGAISDARSTLSSLWSAMRVPADKTFELARCELRPEHLTFETVEFLEAS